MQPTNPREPDTSRTTGALSNAQLNASQDRPIPEGISDAGGAQTHPVHSQSNSGFIEPLQTEQPGITRTPWGRVRNSITAIPTTPGTVSSSASGSGGSASVSALAVPVTGAALTPGQPPSVSSSPAASAASAGPASVPATFYLNPISRSNSGRSDLLGPTAASSAAATVGVAGQASSTTGAAGLATDGTNERKAAETSSQTPPLMTRQVGHSQHDSPVIPSGLRIQAQLTLADPLPPPIATPSRRASSASSASSAKATRPSGGVDHGTTATAAAAGATPAAMTPSVKSTTSTTSSKTANRASVSDDTGDHVIQDAEVVVEIGQVKVSKKDNKTRASSGVYLGIADGEEDKTVAAPTTTAGATDVYARGVNESKEIMETQNYASTHPVTGSMGADVKVTQMSPQPTSTATASARIKPLPRVDSVGDGLCDELIGADELEAQGEASEDDDVDDYDKPDVYAVADDTRKYEPVRQVVVMGGRTSQINMPALPLPRGHESPQQLARRASIIAATAATAAPTASTAASTESKLAIDLAENALRDAERLAQTHAQIELKLSQLAHMQQVIDGQHVSTSPTSHLSIPSVAPSSVATDVRSSSDAVNAGKAGTFIPPTSPLPPAGSPATSGVVSATEGTPAATSGAVLPTPDVDRERGVLQRRGSRMIISPVERAGSSFRDDAFRTLTKEAAKLFSKPISHQIMTRSDYVALRQKKDNTLDFHFVHNNVFMQAHASETPADQVCRSFFSWVVAILIGLIIGFLGFCTTNGVRYTLNWKFILINYFLKDGWDGIAWLVFTAINTVMLVGTAAMVIYIQPLAGASGIPEVKTYLNGSNVPKAFGLTTLVVRLVGMVTTVGACAPAGLQGPMIHTGALVGGWLASNLQWVVKRVCCCARINEEVRYPEDRWKYTSPPRPFPYTTGGTTGGADASVSTASTNEVPTSPTSGRSSEAGSLRTSFRAAAAPPSSTVPLSTRRRHLHHRVSDDIDHPDDGLTTPAFPSRSEIELTRLNAGDPSSSQAGPVPNSQVPVPPPLTDIPPPAFASNDPSTSTSSSTSTRIRARFPAIRQYSMSLLEFPDDLTGNNQRSADQTSSNPDTEDAPELPGRLASSSQLEPRTLPPLRIPTSTSNQPTRTDSWRFRARADSIVPEEADTSEFQPRVYAIEEKDEPELDADPEELAKNPDLEAAELAAQRARQYATSGRNLPARRDLSPDDVKNLPGCGARWWRRLHIPSLGNDRDRRDFISIGAAAGVAASMGAPVGGTLFAAEEISTYWSNELALKTLLACVLASVTAAFFSTGVSAAWGRFETKYYAAFFVGRSESAYTAKELPLFLIIGLFGGVAGSLFTMLNIKLGQIRMNYAKNSKLIKVLDTLVVAILWSTILFVLPYGWSCVPKGTQFEIGEELSSGASPDTFDPERFSCPEDHFNPMASLTFARQDLAIRHLFARHVPNWFGPSELVVWFIVYFLCSAMVSNTSVASGLVIPMLMLGGLSGRLWGVICRSWIDSSIDPGVYAIVGAAAFYGGVSRNSLSLCVIMVEICSDLSFILPILIGSLVGQTVGSFVVEPLYEVQIRAKKLPFLPKEPPAILNTMTVSQIMTRDPIRLGLYEPVSHILDVLSTCSHHGFPVVMSACAENRETEEERELRLEEERIAEANGLSRPKRCRTHRGDGCNNALVGLILRKHLLVLLNRLIWRRRSRPFTPDEFELAVLRPAPRLSDIRARLTPRDLNARLDLGPWVNRTPFTMQSHNLARAAFVLFQTMGLRHVPVVDTRFQLVGIITKLELLRPVLEHRFSRLIEKENEAKAQGGPDRVERYCLKNTALNLRRAFYDSAAYGPMFSNNGLGLYEALKGAPPSAANKVDDYEDLDSDPVFYAPTVADVAANGMMSVATANAAFAKNTTFYRLGGLDLPTQTVSENPSVQSNTTPQSNASPGVGSIVTGSLFQDPSTAAQEEMKRA